MTSPFFSRLTVGLVALRERNFVLYV